jgi:hypothetical protein
MAHRFRMVSMGSFYSHALASLSLISTTLPSLSVPNKIICWAGAKSNFCDFLFLPKRE